MHIKSYKIHVHVDFIHIRNQRYKVPAEFCSLKEQKAIEKIHKDWLFDIIPKSMWYRSLANKNLSNF